MLHIIGPDLAEEVIIASIRKYTLIRCHVTAAYCHLTGQTSVSKRLYVRLDNMISNNDPFWAELGLE
jgi:hypothetical protein